MCCPCKVRLAAENVAQPEMDAGGGDSDAAKSVEECEGTPASQAVDGSGEQAK